MYIYICMWLHNGNQLGECRAKIREWLCLMCVYITCLIPYIDNVLRKGVNHNAWDVQHKTWDGKI